MTKTNKFVKKGNKKMSVSAPINYTPGIDGAKITNATHAAAGKKNNVAAGLRALTAMFNEVYLELNTTLAPLVIANIASGGAVTFTATFSTMIAVANASAIIVNSKIKSKAKSGGMSGPEIYSTIIEQMFLDINSLYTVEVEAGLEAGLPTYKWSGSGIASSGLKAVFNSSAGKSFGKFVYNKIKAASAASSDPEIAWNIFLTELSIYINSNIPTALSGLIGVPYISLIVPPLPPVPLT